MASDQNAQSSPAPSPTGGAHGGPAGAKAAAALQVRALLREAWKGTLGTVARAGGHPYGSLVAIASNPDGAPLLLLSGLAEHTKNILIDQRASILIDGTEPGPAALTGPRVTLVGRIEQANTALARRRYLARHPDAAGFIGFADFNLYALRIEWAHLVAGFGRIVRLEAGDVVFPVDDATNLVEAEPSILEHMNADHPDAIALMAQQELSRRMVRPASSPAGGEEWRMIGCDPEGIDLAAAATALRLVFPHRVTTPDAVREALVGMVRAARSSDGPKEVNRGA